MHKKALGTNQISKICQVSPVTVGRWLEVGKLPFFTTGGGHRRVWQEDIVDFLTAHNYPIPEHLVSSQSPLILVVDDEMSARRFIHRVLKKHLPNAKIEQAVDGFEAGEKISLLIPSIVILDILLPGLDGYKVCEHIRKNERLKNVKILAITGEPTAGTKNKILKSGADDFLAKPFDGKELITSIEKLTMVLNH